MLSLDLPGPFVKGTDIDGDFKKYLLVGAYTWPVMSEARWDELEKMEVHPDWPRIEEEEALRDVAYEEPLWLKIFEPESDNEMAALLQEEELGEEDEGDPVEGDRKQGEDPRGQEDQDQV